jgi:threonine dehydrogenase-like Zn-dependent dehydrogenase
MTRNVLSLARSGHVAVRQEPLPAVEPGMVLIRSHASAISAGTELGSFVGKARPEAIQEPWRTFGYQAAGTVEAVGEGVTRFTLGQRVAGMGAGYALHADRVLVPQNLCVALPDSVSFTDAAFVALGATALQAVRRGEVVFGEHVGIWGLGMLGQLVARVCNAAGASVVGHDPAEKRRALAPLSASVGSLDSAFLCFGGEASDALKEIVGHMRQAPDTHRSGRIVLVGGATVSHGFGAALGNVELRSAARTGPGYHDKAWERGASYPSVTVRWDTQAHLQLFVQWLAERKLTLTGLYETVPLTDAPTSCYALMDRQAEHLGVVVAY